jgi:hypothetical protein
MDILAPKVRLPRVASLPGSPAQGDAVVLTTDGLLYVYDGSAWVAAGLSSELPGGVLSNDLADHYATAANTAGGANNFVAVALVAFTEQRDGGNVEPIIGCYDQAGAGWLLSHRYGQLDASVFVTTYGLVQAAAPTAVFSANARLGELCAVAQRVWTDAGGTKVELWVGPARLIYAESAGFGTPIAETAPFTVLSCSAGTDEGPFNGAFFGCAYYEGTVTDAQMRSILGAAQVRAVIPEDVITWDLCHQGRDGKTAPSSWPAAVGSHALVRAGSPTAIADVYWPSGGAGNYTIAGGGGLSEYDVRKRAVVLGRGR